MPENAMNGYGLIAAIIQAVTSLAWPIALVMIVWFFKKELRRLLPLARVKRGDWEASFRLEQAEVEAAALIAEHRPAPEPPTPEEIGRFDQIVEISPRAAILEQRRALEAAVLQRVAEIPDLPTKKISLTAGVRILRNNEKIDKHTSAILDDLISIGNAAAHRADPFTKEDAERYYKLSQQAITSLAYS